MNCKHCQENAKNHQQQLISVDVKNQIKAHLDKCEACQKFYAAFNLTESFVAKENQLRVNPFMATRVMAKIEQLQQATKEQGFGTARVSKLQPFLVAVSIVFAVFLGVSAGSFYKIEKPANKLPVELSYLDDAAMESLSIFIND